MNYSPLRYPGGKNKLSAFIAKICIDNKISGHYVEPYCGGAAVALFLLMEGFVKKITINDKDRSIYAFWFSVINHTEDLCNLIKNAELSITKWRRQKQIQSDKRNTNLLELGFSTFYLNRTNRSGIINAGVIGGINQNGNYLMDCRFNKENLIERIRKIAAKKKQIKLYNLDAIKLINKIEKNKLKKNTVFYFDPPYYLKASSLYMNHYESSNHKLVSDRIKSIDGIKWIVSYDNVPEIQTLYSECVKKEFSFKHTAYEIREGKEVLFMSKDIKEPEIKDWNPLRFKLKREKTTANIVYK
ncbi:DNA adenine methylase [Flavobacteriaceae bacterium]|nr:DNA adenine methylase [Flavobacteriaceae bacterium]